VPARAVRTAPIPGLCLPSAVVPAVVRSAAVSVAAVLAVCSCDGSLCQIRVGWLRLLVHLAVVTEPLGWR